MKKYIFLTGQYMPTPGATGLCVHYLAKYLVSTGYEVYTICYENGSAQMWFDGVQIKHISVPQFMTGQTEKGWKGKWLVLQSRLHKLVHLKKYPLRSTRLIRSYVRACKALIQKGEEVTVVASYVPLEAVVALTKLKAEYPQINAVFYSTDTISNEQGEDGILSKEQRTKAGMRWEFKLFDVVDKIIIMQCHEKHYFSQTYKKYHEKMFLANFPLLEEPTMRVGMQTDDNKLVYAGTFYRKLRNPTFPLQTIAKALLGTEKKLFVLGGGDCDALVLDAVQAYSKHIEYLGMQSHEVAKKYLCEAAVLLSVGNEKSPMMPSKIYEYIATGKPIIHFYTWEEDPCLPPLKLYGNALCIAKDDEQAVEKVREFIKHPQRKDFEQIRQEFVSSTAQYTIAHME